MEGLGHGHIRETEHGSPDATLATDIAAENVDSFHFHGDHGKFPITAIVVAPADSKAQTILLGQYFSPEETVQIVSPREVMESLIEKVVMVRSYMVAIIAVISTVTLLTMALVIVLSIRLRRAEIVTMSRKGCSRFTLVWVLGSQVVIMLLASSAIAAMLALVTDAYGTEFAKWFIL